MNVPTPVSKPSTLVLCCIDLVGLGIARQLAIQIGLGLPASWPPSESVDKHRLAERLHCNRLSDYQVALSIIVSGLAFLSIFGGALSGIWVAGRLPERHLNTESRAAVSVSMAVVGTLSALVLSLLISNASSAFNIKALAVESLAIDIAKLNNLLVRYGDETAAIRESLRAYSSAKARELAGLESRHDLGIATLGQLDHMSDAVLALHPENTHDKQIQTRILTVLDAISDARWTMAESAGSATPPAFMTILIFWLSLLFISFGLFAPKNHTVIVAILFCALAIAGGIFIILELGSPNSGVIRVSIVPLELAAQQIGTLGR